ncbi:helix-turn-helix domain-containing protein [Natrinema salaciae]|uniref:DNA-binding transcriptional regulator, PadR family n=1 Tax=Natrinema salaciae TaxID=1186196 RepID=A0A1H9K581_9EURY|nr:PadR family transcriptional regulator [Natrinema salaciae]SEQ94324.1 DNA-binding transcriptional regulator, PadR family [Natrinema salaciae]
MPDDDSRDREPPARADASPRDEQTADGRRAWIELTAFQRDCLEAVARRERDGYAGYPSGIKWTLEQRYPTVSRARLEPNLRALVGRGLVATRDGRAGRVPAYRLTDAGRTLLEGRADRLAALCDRRDDDGEEGAARDDRERDG